MSPRYDSRLTMSPSNALGNVKRDAVFSGGAGSGVGAAVAVGSGAAVAVGSGAAVAVGAGVGAGVAVGSGADVGGGAGVSVADDELAAEGGRRCFPGNFGRCVGGFHFDGSSWLRGGFFRRPNGCRRRGRRVGGRMGWGG